MSTTNNIQEILKKFIDQTGKISYNINRMASSYMRRLSDSLRLETAVEHILSGGVHKCCVPISPRSATDRKSMGLEREWQPPTAVKFLPAAVLRAEPSCLLKEALAAKQCSK